MGNGKDVRLGSKPGKKVKQVVAEAVDAVAEPAKAVAKRARKSVAAAKKTAQDHLG